jgi:hypothetical protein
MQWQTAAEAKAILSAAELGADMGVVSSLGQRTSDSYEDDTVFAVARTGLLVR